MITGPTKRNRKCRNPETPGEWQEAVDLAEFWLLVDSAKQYGLVTGGSPINSDRCQVLLALGKSKGFTPASHDVLTRRYITRVITEPDEHQ
jgi:hypothetical protein